MGGGNFYRDHNCSPVAPVYVDGKLKITLRGDNIVPEFIAMLESYVESHYGEAVSAR